jgi:hypothetical protein
METHVNGARAHPPWEEGEEITLVAERKTGNLEE